VKWSCATENLGSLHMTMVLHEYWFLVFSILFWTIDFKMLHSKI